MLSAATQAVVSIFDSHLASKRIPSFRSFLMLVGIVQLTYGALVLFLFPFPEGVSFTPVLAGITAGLLRGASISIMFYSLRKKEVSQVIPVIQTYPIFVAIIAMPLLGEMLNYLQWLAIIIVVAGAVIVSMGKSPAGVINWPGKTFLLLLVASFLFAMANIAAKYALSHISFWNGFSLNALSIAAAFLLFTTRPRVISEIREMPQRNSAIALFVFKETLVLVGMVLLLWAIEIGPVSLVSTIAGSRPVFVVIFSIILSRVFPNFLIKLAGRKMMVLRLAATAMIFGGIAIIYLT